MLGGEEKPSLSKRPTELVGVKSVIQKKFTTVIRNGTRIQPWRPFTLSVPFLSLLTLCSLALIAAIEALNQLSKAGQGLFFLRNTGTGSENLPAAQSVLFNYLPTAVTVVFGMIWVVIDLDVKRLEPFFQLSMPEGANSRDSLLMAYPFDFLPLVPIYAASRRHWAVVFSGTAMVLFWAITPLQSALISATPVTRHTPTLFELPKTLIPVKDQNKALNIEFLYSAYEAAWLDNQMPAFTTKTEAVLPFQLTEQGLGVTNETWTVQTEVFSTSLTCTEAPKNRVCPKFGNCYYNITSSDLGCGFLFQPFSNSNVPQELLYQGNGPGLQNQYLNCPVGTFLAVWAKAKNVTDKDVDVVASFCKASYTRTPASATVDSTGRVVNIEHTGSAKNMDNNTLAQANYELILSSGEVTADTSPYPTLDGPSQIARLEKLQLTGYAYPMSGYAMAFVGNMTFDDLRDMGNLQWVYESAHKLVFASAIPFLLDDAESPGKVTGLRIIEGMAVVVWQKYARLLEAFLALVTALCMALTVTYARRNNALRGDPDSLAAKMSLVYGSEALLQDFEGLDHCTDLDRCLVYRERLRLGQWGDEPVHRLDHNEQPQDSTAKLDLCPAHGEGAGNKVHARPIVFNMAVGISLVLFLLGVLALVCALYRSALSHDGLPQVSSNAFRQSLVYSLIPTGISTILDPFWQLLTRQYCVMQPFEELERGNTAAESLSLKYTSLPPALVLPRSLRSKHFMIAALSAVALAANVLSVALGGLFNDGVGSIGTPTKYTLPRAALIDTQIQAGVSTFSRDSQEEWIVANSNITHNVTLTPWTSQEYFFLPFEPASGKANTRGFGASLKCYSWDDKTVDVSFNASSSNMLGYRINVTLPATPLHPEVKCMEREGFGFTESVVSPNANYTGPVAGEFKIPLMPINGTFSNSSYEMVLEACQGAFVLAVGRINGSFTTVNRIPKTVYDVSTRHLTGVVCEQQFETALFDVTVQDGGYIESYVQTSPPETDLTPYIADKSRLLNYTAQVATLIQSDTQSIRDQGTAQVPLRYAAFYNDTNAHTWPVYLMNKLLVRDGGSILTDPNTPAPTFSEVESAFSQLHRRLYAILLGLNYEAVFRANPNGGKDATVIGTIYHLEQRVFVDKIMFLLVVIIISGSILVTAAAYVHRPQVRLPRLPTSLASEIGFFYKSKALEYFEGTEVMSSHLRKKKLEERGGRYGYGNFRAKGSSTVHRGIERQELLETDVP